MAEQDQSYSRSTAPGLVFPRPCLLLFALLMFAAAAARAEESKEGAANVQAEVRVRIVEPGPLWVGAQATLAVDLMTTGQTFSGQLLSLPEVAGALLLRKDTTTLKLSERRAGRTWQVLRYPVALFPQRAGELTVPAFDIRFDVSAGYGKAAQSFSFRTEEVTTTARLPDGVSDAGLLVTTSAYELTWDWSPLPGDAPVQLQPGDAITLTVTQRADAVSGMVLPALPVHRADGLAAYPAAPVVEDRVVRGALEGTRTDSVTWMVEGGGPQSLPALAYRWFDPVREELRTTQVPGLEIAVRAEPRSRESGDRAAASASKWWQTMLPALLVLAAVLAIEGRYRALSRVATYLWDRRARARGSEAALFRAASAACARGDAAATYDALSRWQHRLPGDGTPELLALAEAPGGEPAQVEGLAQSLEALQRALADGSAWDGATLAAQLPALRQSRLSYQRDAAASPLAPLNP